MKKIIRNFIIAYIPCRQPTNKTNCIKLISFLLQEVIILSCILNGIPQTPLFAIKIHGSTLMPIFYSLIAVRIVFSFIYFFLKHQAIFSIYLTLTMAFTLLFSKQVQNIYLPFICFILQIMMSIIYALGHEMRINKLNLTGRLNLTPFIFRQAIVFAIVYLSILLEKLKILQIMFPLVFIRMILVQSQILTNLILKKSLVRLEIVNILILFITIQMGYYYTYSMSFYLSVCSTILILYFLHLPFIKPSSQIPYKIADKIPQQQKQQKCTTQQALEYVLHLNSWITTDSYEDLLNFVYFHRKICKNLGCSLWFKSDQNFDDGEYSLDNLKKMIIIHIEKTLLVMKKQNEQLQKFKIYFLSPSSKANQFLNKDKFYCQRQLYRLEQGQNIKEQTNMAIEAQFQQKNYKLAQRIKKAILLREKIYRKLLNKYIMMSSVIQMNEEILKLEKKIIDFNGNFQFLSYTNKFRLNKFFAQFMPQRIFQNQMNDPEFILQSGSKQFISIMLGAEGNRFGKVINVNQQALKWIYMSKAKALTITFNELVPEQFRQQHLKIIEHKYSKVTTFDSYNQIPQTIFFFNSLGYIVLGKARIYRLTNQKGRYWNVIYDPNYLQQAVIAMSFSGRMIGFNEMAASYGLKKEMLGKPISKSIVNFLLNSYNAKFLSEFDEQFFEDDDTIFEEGLAIQKVETIQRMCKYIIIKLNEVRSFCMFYQRTMRNLQVDEQNYFNYEDGKVILTKELNPQQDNNEDPKFTLSRIPTLQKRKTEISQINVQEIDQMILINNKIDYKRNIKINEDQNKQIPAKPLNILNDNVSAVSQEFYKNNLSERLQRSSLHRMRWFLFLAGCILLIVLCIVLLTSFLEISHFFRRQAQIETFFMINKQFLGYTRIGMLPANQIVHPQLIVKNQIKQISDEIQTTWKLLEKKEPTIQNLKNIQIPKNQFNQGYIGKLQDQQKKFQIALQQYLANESQPAILKVVTYLLLSIFPGYKAAVNILNEQYQDNQMNWKTIMIILRISSLTLFVIHLLFSLLIRNMNSNSKKQILNIISKIPDSTLIMQIAKAKYLKNQAQSVWEFLNQQKYNNILLSHTNDITYHNDKNNKNHIPYSVLKNNENQKISLNQSKKINDEKNCVSNIILFVILLAIIPIYAWEFIHDYQGANNYYLIRSFYKYSNEMVATSYSLWAGYNFNNQIDQEFFQQMEEYMHQCADQAELFLVNCLNKQAINKKFFLFYEKLMYNNICQELKEQMPTCYTDYNTALKGGMRQVISYIMRKYQRLQQLQEKKVPLLQSELLSLTQLDNVIKANSFYYPYLMEQIQTNLLIAVKQNQRIQLIKQIIVGIAQFIIIVAVGIFTFTIVNKEQLQCLILQNTLVLIPFEKMLKVPNFKQLIVEKIKSKRFVV